MFNLTSQVFWLFGVAAKALSGRPIDSLIKQQVAEVIPRVPNIVLGQRKSKRIALAVFALLFL